MYSIVIVKDMVTAGEQQGNSAFSGPSGKFLAATLTEYGVDPALCKVLNVVSQRTDLDSLPKEDLKIYMASLRSLLQEVNPKYILTLGNISLKAVLGSSGITAHRGVESLFGESVVVPTFSPSAVLRTPKYLNQFKADLQKFCLIVQGTTVTKKYNPVVKLVMTREDLVELIGHLDKATKIVGNWGGLDTETTTFDYWRPQTRIMTLGLCVDDNICWGLPLHHPKSPWRDQSEKLMSFIRKYIEDDKFKWAGNNWKYDQKWMRAKYGITVNFGPDNMLMGYASDENSPHGLKYQADYWCQSGHYDKDITFPKFDPVKDDIDEVISQYYQLNLVKLLKYNALDAYYSRNVYPLERDRLMKDIRSARIYKHLLEDGSKIFTEIEENGMWVDPERLQNALKICQEEITRTKDTLDALIPGGWVERNLSPKTAKKGFNWNSTKQLGLLFFQEDGFNFPIIMETEKGAPSTAESVMIELGVDIDHPALEGLLEYRKWSKYMSTYLLPWSCKLDHNNRIHPNFKLHGTVTGRLSGEDGVHQVPRDNFIRGLIGAPPGWSFFEIDGSQIELRVVAVIAMEATMLRVYATRGDIHRTTASTVTGKAPEDVTGPDRKKAKAVNFGFVYGMGWRKFKIYSWEKYGIRLTDNEAKEYRTRFFSLYADLKAWHDRMKMLVKKCGYVVSPIGRKRRLPNIYSSDREIQAAAEREAINSPVQGLGSDIVLAAFIDMVLNAAGLADINWRESLRPVGAVHDAQYWEIRNDMIDFWAPLIKANFDDLSRLKRWFGYSMPIEMIGDCKIGAHWGDAKDWIIGEPLPFVPREV